MPITEFTKDVCDKIGYYVYRLIDPRNGETFYIGKGKDNRVFHHISGILDDKEDNEDVTNEKVKRINSIKNSGLEVIHVIHRHRLNEDEAFHVEGALIDAFPSLTNQQNGHGNSDIGAMHVDDVQTLHQAEEFTPQHKLILLTMRQHFLDERGAYEGCRGVWRMKMERAQLAEFVLPVLNGIVVDVFKPLEWLRATTENFPIQIDEDMPDRIGFRGERADEDIRKIYVKRRPPKDYLGARIATRYTYD